MTRIASIKETFSSLSRKKIVVDLTPILPGGENGGAKLMTIELLAALARLLPVTDFIVLTAESSHSELDWLEAQCSNIRRTCVLHNDTPVNPSSPIPPPVSRGKEKVFYRLKILADRILPFKLQQQFKTILVAFPALRERAINQLKAIFPLTLRRRIKCLFRSVIPIKERVSLLRQIGADLLFCPFTAPFYADPLVPTVSVIYDLQYRAYPHFFTPEESIEREDNFRKACQMANYLITISEFVRQVVIQAADFPQERVIAVPIGLLHSSARLESEDFSHMEVLKKYDLQQGEYVFYPANFWQHKNHAMLLTAFNLYRLSNPTATLKLVCTGAPGRRAEAFREAVSRMGLSQWVIYPGYVPPNEYDVLLKSAFAVIFPSLYEGFGIPILEAMSVGIPVLCSSVTSLPEVGGDAVLYFDPRRPSQIVNSLTRLLMEPGLRESLITKGLERAHLFRGADRMAVEYASVFSKAVQSQAISKSATGN